MKSYSYWTEYLKSAKNGHDRPIHGSATKRVLHGHNGDIVLRLHTTDVVTLHADGTQTIRTGGWNTVTTRAFIQEYSHARVWTEQGDLYVRIETPPLTAPRVRKCRRCTDGRVPQRCIGPGWCYRYYGRTMCEHGETDSHRNAECSHGETGAHALPSSKCWQCEGVGRFDYGSNPVHLAWDGSPLLIDAAGYPIGPATPAPYVPAGKSAHHSGGWNTPCDCPEAGTPEPTYVPPVAATSSYSDSGQLLTAALPGMAAVVKMPCDCGSEQEVMTVVIHLNDRHHWTREEIADWLDALDVDLSFPVPDTIPAHIR